MWNTPLSPDYSASGPLRSPSSFPLFLGNEIKVVVTLGCQTNGKLANINEANTFTFIIIISLTVLPFILIQIRKIFSLSSRKSLFRDRDFPKLLPASVCFISFSPPSTRHIECRLPPLPNIRSVLLPKSAWKLPR